jgi:hypothetical protein
MSSSKREFRGNKICGSNTSFKGIECILPLHFDLPARLGGIWHGKYTNSAV